jgi:hypothetical protein
MFEIEPNLRPTFQVSVFTAQRCFEQRHAASDIPTREMWVENALGDEGGSDRPSMTRVETRKTDSASHTWQPGRRTELPERLHLDPIPGGSDQAKVCW